MNAERLHKILVEVSNELSSTGIVVRLATLKAALQNMVNQPQQPQYQQKVAQQRDALNELLANAPSNHFSPSWKQVLQELGVDWMLGSELLGFIEEAFTQNEITPSKALEKIEDLANQVKDLETGVRNTLEGLQYLEVGQEELEGGQCEIGYLIPRRVVDSELKGFYKEVGEWNFILDHISEVVEGGKSDFKVRNISSSDFMIYIGASLVLAEFIARATERIIAAYKTILEIKVLREELKKKGVPDKETKGIADHANGLMKEEIKRIVAEALKEYDSTKDVGRRHELSNALAIALNKLANRIDRGFSVEVRVRALPEPEDGQRLSKELSQSKKLISSIEKASAALEFIKSEGEAILALPEAESKEKAEKR